MPAIVVALIFTVIGAGLQAVLGFAVLPSVMPGFPVMLALVGTIVAGVFGFVTGLLRVYALRPRSIWVFLLDVSWSALNTATGLVFLIYCFAKGTREPPTELTQDRGAIWFSGAALPGADATTIGTVMGGVWLAHETVHIQQARIFGPLYWPVYLATYLGNMLARFLTGRFNDPHWQAYERVVMEDWAYHAAPGNSVEVAPSILWCALAAVNGFAIAVLLNPIPAVGALPSAIGLDAIPWWIGLIVLLVYALGRSFLPKARDPITGLVYA